MKVNALFIKEWFSDPYLFNQQHDTLLFLLKVVNYLMSYIGLSRISYVVKI